MENTAILQKRFDKTMRVPLGWTLNSNEHVQEISNLHTIEEAGKSFVVRMRILVLQKAGLACAFTVVILLLMRCKFTQDCHQLMYGYLKVPVAKEQLQQPPLAPSYSNSLTYVYVVGVEGVGHHGIVPAIAQIGRACNYHVVYEHKLLRQYQFEQQVEDFRSILEVSKHAKAPLSDVLVVEDASFPSGRHLRYGSDATKKANGRYDLEWIYDQITTVGDISIRFLFLNRNFYRAVASHVDFDGSFHRHAEVLHNYTWYIHSEYERIQRKRPDLWRQIKYEWFTEMSDCPSLAGNITAFLGLQHCDIDKACQRMATTVKKERVIVVNETERAIAESFHVDVPIPLLTYEPQSGV